MNPSPVNGASLTSPILERSYVEALSKIDHGDIVYEEGIGGVVDVDQGSSAGCDVRDRNTTKNSDVGDKDGSKAAAVAPSVAAAASPSSCSTPSPPAAALASSSSSKNLIKYLPISQMPCDLVVYKCINNSNVKQRKMYLNGFFERMKSMEEEGEQWRESAVEVVKANFDFLLDHLHGTNYAITDAYWLKSNNIARYHCICTAFSILHEYHAKIPRKSEKKGELVVSALVKDAALMKHLRGAQKIISHLFNGAASLGGHYCPEGDVANASSSDIKESSDFAASNLPTSSMNLLRKFPLDETFAVLIDVISQSKAVNNYCVEGGLLQFYVMDYATWSDEFHAGRGYFRYSCKGGDCEKRDEKPTISSAYLNHVIHDVDRGYDEGYYDLFGAGKDNEKVVKSKKIISRLHKVIVAMDGVFLTLIRNGYNAFKLRRKLFFGEDGEGDVGWIFYVWTVFFNLVFDYYKLGGEKAFGETTTTKGMEAQEEAVAGSVMNLIQKFKRLWRAAMEMYFTYSPSDYDCYFELLRFCRGYSGKKMNAAADCLYGRETEKCEDGLDGIICSKWFKCTIVGITDVMVRSKRGKVAIRDDEQVRRDEENGCCIREDQGAEKEVKFYDEATSMCKSFTASFSHDKIDFGGDDVQALCLCVSLYNGYKGNKLADASSALNEKECEKNLLDLLNRCVLSSRGDGKLFVNSALECINLSRKKFDRNAVEFIRAVLDAVILIDEGCQVRKDCVRVFEEIVSNPSFFRFDQSDCEGGGKGLKGRYDSLDSEDKKLYKCLISNIFGVFDRKRCSDYDGATAGAHEVGKIDGDDDSDEITRKLSDVAMTLLGILTAGEECLALYVISYLPSCIRKFLDSELTNSKRRRAQVMHSDGLRNGNLSNEPLLTLCEECDVRENEEDVSLLLPLTEDWLLHILSSASQSAGSQSVAVTRDSSSLKIAMSAVSLLSYRSSVRYPTFYRSMPNSSKLYHVLVLADSSLICNSDLCRASHKILDSLSNEVDGGSVVKCCEFHKYGEENDTEILHDPEKPQARPAGYMSKDVRAWSEFVLGFAGSFTSGTVIDDGQLAARCLRIMLRPCFPPSVTEEAFGRLRGYLRLLSEQVYDDEVLEAAVSCSKKLPTSLLETYLNMLRGDFCLRHGYFFKLAILSLLHDFATTQSQAAKDRLSKIESGRPIVDGVLSELAALKEEEWPLFNHADLLLLINKIKMQ